MCALPWSTCGKRTPDRLFKFGFPTRITAASESTKQAMSPLDNRAADESGLSESDIVRAIVSWPSKLVVVLLLFGTIPLWCLILTHGVGDQLGLYVPAQVHGLVSQTSPHRHLHEISSSVRVRGLSSADTPSATSTTKAPSRDIWTVVWRPFGRFGLPRSQLSPPLAHQSLKHLLRPLLRPPLLRYWPHPSRQPQPRRLRLPMPISCLLAHPPWHQ
jgi:hypothetical protein